MNIYKVIYFILNIIKNVIKILVVLFFPIMIILESISTGDYRWMYFMLSVLAMIVVVWCSFSFYEFIKNKINNK
jgi:bacteriorhodopsin